MDLFFELSSFSIPRQSLFVLIFKPFLVIGLDFGDLLFKFFDFSFMETGHFFDSQVEGFDLSVFVGNLGLKLAFFGHHFFSINGFRLYGLNVFDLGHGDFGGLVFDLFLMKHDEILELLMFPFILDFKLIESVIVLFSQFKLGMDFPGEFFTDVSEKGPEVIGFSGVGSECVLELGSEGFNICFVQL